ncbi:Lrp/AsnC family transcriptional regulator [Oceanospirillaceae bacterium]|jgi:DNA-binding Lrp family transcriptional regulator|nr:Lrp/AsnC family transcriptional regulator [Oceanospirillaceae bacterium]MDC1340776.1 Lrp/AsnC family transcriptional regulator [Oceanospirillaceae bacterium]|tara:strand:+ start:365 stop:802 length:438 start_codon:yes stop_codon:yes gene_type:complete
MSDFIDSKDQSIISLLQKDGRMSVKDIAKAMGLTRTTVTKRMERLEASGVITGYSAVVRKDFFDKKIRGWVMINTIPNLEEAAISAMKMIPEVSRIYTTNGRWDLAVAIWAADLESFDAALTKIRQVDGIESTETNLLLSSRIGN